MHKSTLSLMAFTLVSIILAGSSVYWAWASFHRMRLERQSFNWPHADARLLSISRRMEQLETESGVRRAERVTFKFQYQASGQSFTADESVTTAIKLPAELRSSTVLPGQSFKLHYDPANPARYVLTPGISANTIFGLVFGPFIVLVFGLLSFYETRFFMNRADLKTAPNPANGKPS